jgi:hypothetical protein
MADGSTPTFRDNLAQHYRSSNVAKRNKCRQEKQGKTNNVLESTLLTSWSMPAAKRMRVEVVPMVTPSMPDLTASEGPASWFDWEMPMRDLEIATPAALVVKSPRRSSFSHEGLFHLIPEPGSDGTIDPFQFDFSSYISKTSSVSMKDFSTSSSMVLEGAFKRRTAAAFAA